MASSAASQLRGPAPGERRGEVPQILGRQRRDTGGYVGAQLTLQLGQLVTHAGNLPTHGAR